MYIFTGNFPKLKHVYNIVFFRKWPNTGLNVRELALLPYHLQKMTLYLNQKIKNLFDPYRGYKHRSTAPLFSQMERILKLPIIA